MASVTEECILCSLPSMNLLGNKQNNNQIKFQVRSIFVLRKLLGISSSTCTDLLQNGNPSTWFSYCVECFEIVIEAERVFTKLIKLESKWKILKHNVGDKTTSTATRSKNKVICRIRDEATSVRRYDSEINTNESERDIKVEIEDFCLNEDYTPHDFSDSHSDVDEQEKLIDKSLSTENNCRTTPQQESGLRTRSGRLIKPKNLFDSEDKDIGDENLPEECAVEDNNDQLSSEEDNGFPCSFCAKIYRTKSKQFAHENRVHGQTHIHQCEVCLKIFSSDHTLERHEFEFHSGLPKTLTRHKRTSDTNFGLPLPLEDIIDKLKKTGGDTILKRHLKLRTTLKLKDLHCQDCNKLFRNIRGLKYHKSRYHGKHKETPFQCQICGKRFTTKRIQREHIEKHHSQSLLEKSTSNDAVSNDQHDQDQAESQFLFTCVHCAKQCLNEVKLKMHIYKNHKNIFKCSKCEECFATTGHLEIHQETLHQNETTGSNSLKESTYRCKQCNRSFLTLRGRRRHETDVHVLEKEKPYPCDRCPRRFMTYKLLRVHERVAHKEDKSTPAGIQILKPEDSLTLMIEDKLQCPECSKKFLNNNRMKLHFELVHKKLRNFMCEICSKSFQMKSDMVNHQKKEHEQSEELKCKACGIICCSSVSLKRHIASVHEKSKCNNKCPVCDFATISKSVLDGHILMRHTNEKPFSCNQCEKSYVANSDLKTHMRLHTGDRPFVCQICQKDFHNKKKLKRHMEDLHSTGKNFMCSECGKRFPSKHYLTSHIYDIHKKRKRDPVEEKLLIDSERLKEIVLENNSSISAPNAYFTHLKKKLENAEDEDSQQINE